MLLLTSLLFSGLLMTQASLLSGVLNLPDLLSGVLNLVDKILGDLDQPPLDDPVYVFEVSTDAPISDVKAALSDVTVRQSFKIIGENRYFFVITNDNTEALRDLAFPSGSVVTQIPAEHNREYLRMFGVSSGFEESYDTEDLFADDATITVFDGTLLLPDDITIDTVNTLMRGFAQTFSQAHDIVKPLIYAAVCSYPPRFFVFVTVNDNVIQTLITKDLIAEFIGPGLFDITISHAVKI